MEQLIATTLSNLPKGEFFKRTPTAKTVYRRGDYDRASKSFSCIDCDDICREIFIKSTKQVFTGFTY